MCAAAQSTAASSPGDSMLRTLRRQNLTAIRVSFMKDLPSAMVALLICFAPLMALQSVGVSTNDLDDSPRHETPNPPPQLRQLTVSLSNSVCDVLAGPNHSRCTTNLHKFSVEADQMENGLIFAVHRGLEYIRFDMCRMSSQKVVEYTLTCPQEFPSHYNLYRVFLSFAP